VLPQAKHPGNISTVSFSPDRRWLITISGNTVQLFDEATLRYIATVDHTNAVDEIAFSPDGKWIATRTRTIPEYGHYFAGRRALTRVWETQSFQEAASREDELVRFMNRQAPTRNLYVLTPTQTALLSDSISWRTVSFRAQAPREYALESPDHRWSAAKPFGKDGVSLADVSSTRQVSFLQHDGAVNALAFSIDSRWLATASDDHTVRIWALRCDDLIEQACARLTRNLSREEWQKYLGNEPYSATCPQLPVPEN
jgi:WD40 repeat protein